MTDRPASAVSPSAPPAGFAKPPDGRVAAALAGSGRPLEPSERTGLESHLGADLSGVRVHDDSLAAEATRGIGAKGLALGDHVALATGRHDPASSTSRGLLTHELAHVVQQRATGSNAVVQLDNGGTAAPATTLDTLPAADRKQIQAVTTTRITVPGLAEKFATTGTTVTMSLPAGVTVAFDGSVASGLQHGLTNVAGSISAGVELTPAPLLPNSTATLELDVPVTGKGLYRFTYDAPAALAGKAAAAPRIIVEALGKASPPAGTKAPPAAKEGAPPVVDQVADKIKKHGFIQSYAGKELDALRAALDQIPDAQLTIVDGLKFSRGTAKKGDPAAAGDYDPSTHTVTMYDKAFTPSDNRFQGPAAIASDGATRAIVHEIGHAVDLAPMRKASAAKATADSTLATATAPYIDPNDPTSYSYPKGGAAEKDIKAAEKTQKDAESTVLTTRSVSGTKSVKDSTGTIKDVIGTDVGANKFREAVAKDGGKAVSAYGDKDFQESFAEAYSLYITSPDTLKALRPNVYAFFVTALPK